MSSVCLVTICCSYRPLSPIKIDCVIIFFGTYPVVIIEEDLGATFVCVCVCVCVCVLGKRFGSPEKSVFASAGSQWKFPQNLGWILCHGANWMQQRQCHSSKTASP